MAEHIPVGRDLHDQRMVLQSAVDKGPGQKRVYAQLGRRPSRSEASHNRWKKNEATPRVTKPWTCAKQAYQQKRRRLVSGIVSEAARDYVGPLRGLLRDSAPAGLPARMTPDAEVA